MSAGHRADPIAIPSNEFDSAQRRPASFEAENARLRAANTSLTAAVASLRQQLALRDHALDATATFFLITEIRAPEPIIVYCNKAVADQHGFTQQELIGKPLSTLVRWIAGNPQYVADVAAALRAGETLRHENQVERKDRSTFWLGVTIHPVFDADGVLTHSVAVGTDITAKRLEILKQQELQDKLLNEMRERERMSIELQLAQKLESVGRLAAGVAHEINTPIQYVGDSVHFLRSAYDDLNQVLDAWREAIDRLPETPARQALQDTLAETMLRHDLEFLRAEIPRSFDRIFDGVDRVTNIVKAMKEFAHPDTHEHGPANLNHALQTTLLVASNEYKYLATVDTQFGELPEVVCNVGELNQVFLNLIVNAAHAIADAGKDLASGRISVTSALDGDAAVICIADNGCGIPVENQTKIYDPFYTTKEVGRGSGQGLAITHSILVDKHGGDISVHSELGVGTKFTLRLPLTGRESPNS